MSSKRIETTEEERKLIIKLRKENYSFRKIGEVVKRPYSTIKKIVDKYNKTETICNSPRSGRPQALNAAEKLSLIREKLNHPKIPATKLTENLKENLNKRVCSNTVRNVFKAHQKESSDFWHRMISTGESNFNIYGNDGGEWRNDSDINNLQNNMNDDEKFNNGEGLGLEIKQSGDDICMKIETDSTIDSFNGSPMPCSSQTYLLSEEKIKIEDEHSLSSTTKDAKDFEVQHKIIDALNSCRESNQVGCSNSPVMLFMMSLAGQIESANLSSETFVNLQIKFLQALSDVID